MRVISGGSHDRSHMLQVVSWVKVLANRSRLTLEHVQNSEPTGRDIFFIVDGKAMHDCLRTHIVSTRCATTYNGGMKVHVRSHNGTNSLMWSHDGSHVVVQHLHLAARPIARLHCDLSSWSGKTVVSRVVETWDLCDCNLFLAMDRTKKTYDCQINTVVCDLWGRLVPLWITAFG